ncbi:hypothetical protein PsYK624_104500 [Phanerochaete sordida]|uniref:Uncharacterized protein n=1 Tax=Phanerochaete sordida TaxID=48140 RepID=A0A9P3GG23_9APHY|nr:hypothetical protein PsYK624_104500 [Phanerochaete sordida]
MCSVLCTIPLYGDLPRAKRLGALGRSYGAVLYDISTSDLAIFLPGVVDLTKVFGSERHCGFAMPHEEPVRTNPEIKRP